MRHLRDSHPNLVRARSLALFPFVAKRQHNVVNITFRCCLQIIFAAQSKRFLLRSEPASEGYIFAHLGWFGVVRKDGCFCRPLSLSRRDL